MTRRHVLMMAALVAVLLLAVDIRGLFDFRSLHRLWNWLWTLCGRLAAPLPMALVTLAAALMLPRDDARLPVTVNLAAALLLGVALQWLDAPHALLRLTPDAARFVSSLCFYGFLLWTVRQYCSAGMLRRALTALLTVTVLIAAVRALPDGPRFLSGMLTAAAVSGAYLWLLTGLARRRASKADA